MLLLNRVLTVEPGRPASHRGKGWEPITDAAIRALVASGWPAGGGALGQGRADPAPLLGDDTGHRVRAPVADVRRPRVLRVEAVLPGEPLLVEQGGEPVDWTL